MTLNHWARQQPDAIALQDAHASLSWGELPAAIDRVADRLERDAGQRIALLADNSRHWVLADLAALKLQRPLIPVPLFFSEEQRAHLFSRAGIDTLMTVEDDQLQIRRLQIPATELHPGTAKITFTSGTTGAPKGVCLSADQQLQVAHSLAERLSGLGIRRHLCLLPLATLLENIAGVYTALLMGASVQLPPLATLGWQGSSGLNVEQLLSALHQHRPDSLITLPQILSALAATGERGTTLPELRFIAVGGARVGADLIRRARAQGLPAYEGYGLSECASVVSLNTPGQDSIGSAGRALGHNHLNLSAEGELLIEGNCMLGYLGEPPHSGVYATGDLVRVDNSGFLHIEGRRRNVIINSYGRNLSPEWVESELLAQPGIEEAVLYGEARPFNCALIHAPSLNNDQLDAHLARINARLPDYARVRQWTRPEISMRKQSGLYTLNGRPRRAAIATHFADTLESIYATDC
ncbi:AMP-binding protein [Marinobacterium sp. 3-1745]|uniref:AMP-binding protein n=2 Tax=Marinobacterium marinum TaxID=2756129 RepID=A0A7W2ACC8_9GAMM|nr:AMP-binding protein [Marinobacterium marinum]